MGNITREQIDKLRKAAAALVEDCTEPCWGLAQDLSAFVEQLVLNNAELRQAERGCPACGQYRDSHYTWCIHAHEQPAADRSPALPVHYFGCCPHCHEEGRIIYVECDEWCICDKHMIAWYISTDLFPGPGNEHDANRALIEQCKRIEQPDCICQQLTEGQVCHELPDNFCSYPGPLECSNCDRAGSNCGRLMADNPFREPVNEDNDQSFSDIMSSMGW